MTIVRWEPARELGSLQHEMNRLFGSLFDGGTATQGASERRWIPAMDLLEDEDRYVLRADLPGVSEDDVKIEFEDNVLTISGERRTEREDRSEGFVRVERTSGSFTRSLTLPSGIDASSIDAAFSNGVLEVTVPKPAQRKPHRVAIGSRTVEGSEPAQPVEQPAS